MKRIVVVALIVFGARGFSRAEQTAGDAANGKRVFERDGCYECHGYAGEGGRDGARIAQTTMPAPAFVRYVRRPSGSMPAFTEKVLSDQELADIYAYLKSMPAARAAAEIPLLDRVRAATPRPPAREARIPVGGASLFARETGNGQPIVVVHGGPDFDSRYLLPDMDRLADGYRLIYYDQRGRGRSADGVRPADVSMRSEVADIDAVRAHFQLPKTAVLGHSWGGVLALEYAIAHPDRVSHLILLNSGPASADDYTKFRAHYLEAQGAAMERQLAIAGGDAYKAADPDAIESRYRIHFAPAFARPAYLEVLLQRMRPTFESGVLQARAIEDRLMAETWSSKSYDLRPKLARLKIPTLVVWSDHDFIPFDATKPIADAIPGARLVTLKQCGHFSFLECPVELRTAVDEFFQPR